MKSVAWIFPLCMSVNIEIPNCEFWLHKLKLHLGWWVPWFEKHMFCHMWGNFWYRSRLSPQCRPQWFDFPQDWNSITLGDPKGWIALNIVSTDFRTNDRMTESAWLLSMRLTCFDRCVVGELVCLSFLLFIFFIYVEEDMNRSWWCSKITLWRNILFNVTKIS